jgi:hypothetical protein
MLWRTGWAARAFRRAARRTPSAHASSRPTLTHHAPSRAVSLR